MTRRGHGSGVLVLDAPEKIPLIRSKGVQRDYFSALMPVVREIADAVRELLLPQLEAIAQDQRSRLSLTIDAPSDDADRALKTVKERLATRLNPTRLAQIAEEAAGKADLVNRSQVQGQLKALGTGAVFRDTVALGTIKADFIKTNVALVKDIPAKALRNMDGILSRGLAKGARAGTIARQLTKEVGLTRKRAKLIARDQVTKLNSQLTRQRYLANGITHSIWVTMGDDDVRDTHAVRDGRRFPNETGLGGIFPGEEINCRCSQQPAPPRDKGGRFSRKPPRVAA